MENIWIDTARELYNLQNQRKVIEKREKDLAELLKKLSDNMPKQVDGMKYSFSLRPGNIDYSLISEIQNINLDLYRKAAVQVWKLTIESI